MTNKLAIICVSDGRKVCNECFNKLNETEREGRGALPVGWTSPDTPTVDCEIYGRPAFDTGETEKESG